MPESLAVANVISPTLGAIVLTSIKGLVDRLELGPSRGLMPLYEALSNSFDAVAERQLGSGKGQIRLVLAYQHGLAVDDEALKLIDGVDVIDTGVGFGDKQLASFEEAYTLAKVKIGGKGVGRFTFLKVFDRVSVRSVFEQDGKRYLREFSFSVSGEVQGAEKKTETTEDIGTTVSLRGMDSKYLPAWSHDLDELAERIITHFLIRFASRSCPRTYLESGARKIELNDLFDKTVQPHINELPYTVGAHTLNLQVFRNKDGRARHELHYCANGREVVKARLADLLPELPERFVGVDDKNYTLMALVTGEYFDAHANQQRTEITFQPEGPTLDIDEGLVTRSAIDEATGHALRGVLKVDLQATTEAKLEQIDQFVEAHPEYRALTHEKYRDFLEVIPPGLSEEKLDEALLHVRRKVEDKVRKEEVSVTQMMEKESFETYKARMNELIESMNELGKAKLAEYVGHRRVILDLVQNNLKKSREDAKYPLESVLHNLIFPMGYTSQELFLEHQNLWMIDERLCFHSVLTSDKKLKSIKGLENTSGREPDIFAFFYDTPVGVAEPDDAGGAIVLIEFKRPMRDDYEEDPGAQLYKRFVEISEGKVTSVEGRPININKVRYVGYLIADITPSLRRHVKPTYYESFDGDGYYKPLTMPGYVEIISYDKLIRDAKRRNRVLFEKLGIHKN